MKRVAIGWTMRRGESECRVLEGSEKLSDDDDPVPGARTNSQSGAIETLVA